MNIRRFRALHEAGASFAEIARECGCDWRTVHKYLDDRAPAVPPAGSPRAATQPRVITPLAAVVDGWLRAEIPLRAAGLDELLDDRLPVLLAMSDNGPQMTSHSTREFMAACAIMQRLGRPGTPHRPRRGSSRCSGMSKPNGPTSSASATRASSKPNSTAPSRSTTPSRLHVGIGYVTAGEEHHGRGDGIRQACGDGLARARAARIAYRQSNRTGQSNRTEEPDDREPHLAGYFHRRMLKESDTPQRRKKIRGSSHNNSRFLDVSEA